MKTLTQLSKEELEALGKLYGSFHILAGANNMCLCGPDGTCSELLLAHDRRIIEAAFAATEMDISELNVGDDSEARGILAALSEANNLKQEFLND